MKRWIEDPTKNGFRFVGYCDDIVDIGHNGWFVTEDGDDGCVTRGAVFQIAGKGGVPRFVPGMSDPYFGQCYLINIGDIYFGDPEQLWSPRDQQAAFDAAEAANSLAEKYAEKERDYDYSWRAGQKYSDLAKELRYYRNLLRVTRRVIRSSQDNPLLPFVERARDKLKINIIDIIREMRSVKDDFSGNIDAFNDGAGREIFK